MWTFRLDRVRFVSWSGRDDTEGFADLAAATAAPTRWRSVCMPCTDMLMPRLAHHLPLLIAVVRAMPAGDRAVLAAAFVFFAICLAAILVGEATYGVPLVGVILAGSLTARWLGERIFPGIAVPAVLLMVALVWTVKWAWTHVRW